MSYYSTRDYYRTGSKETQHFVSHRCAERPSYVSIRRYEPDENGWRHPDQYGWRLAHLDVDPEWCYEFLNDVGAPITYCPFCGERLGDA